MKVELFDIQWDTQSDDDGLTPPAEELGLPLSHTVEVDDDFDVVNEGADLLSDKFGYCVFGFQFDIL